MHLHLFLLLFSSGAFSYFLPLKEELHLQNKTKSSIIDEMLCLLEAENESINKTFCTPVHMQNESCAHYNTNHFIKELKNKTKSNCMKIIEKDMVELENTCPFLKEPSSKNDKRCSPLMQTNFSHFKKSLEEFLKWVNRKQDCSHITRSESGLYPDGQCTCPDPWKYRKGSP